MSFKRKIQKNKQLLLPSDKKHSFDIFGVMQTMETFNNPRGSNKFLQPTEKTPMDYKAHFVKSFNNLSRRHNAWSVWSDFIFMSACAISNRFDKTHYDERESAYLSVIAKYDKKERELFPKLLSDVIMALEFNPEQDFLGRIFMCIGLGNKHNGQFFTPYNICKLMAETTMQDVVDYINKNGYLSINDPCCGAGATLIAAANVARRKLYEEKINFQNHIFMVGQDIDQIAGLMCYIQLSLLGVAGYVKIGNSLTEPVISSDNHKNYWYTPMYYSDVWAMRRIIKSIGKLTDDAIVINQKGERKNDEHN